jgi:outer membrane protein OmpA-like peptidoglycan-associated protein
MLKNVLTIIFSLILTYSSLAQSSSERKIYVFSDSWVFSLEGGFTVGFTDYMKTKVDGSLRGGVEYYFSRTNENVFGLKLFGGGQRVAGSDERMSVNTKDGIRDPLPTNFITDMYILGLAASYSYSINDRYFPFVQLGVSYLYWINPQDENGKKLEGNLLKLYEKFAPAFDADFGVKIRFSDKIGISVSGGIHITSTDYLDDIATGNNNDFYYTGMIGITVSPFGPGDSDDDGIIDEYDACPNDAEDFDGFEDDDGCPDPDNDFDGIPDNEDNCPFSTEDFDGFADSDGCPDPDNDLDGILDVNDNCPDQPEDVDGYLDQDGCPDLDNDNDGIPDVDDQCPNQAETINGYEDQDGCPDQVRMASVKRITILGKDIFYDNTATVKPEGVSRLNEAFETINHEPNSKWRIEGHMDSQGSEQFIRKISYDRADAVLEFFTSHGLTADRFSIYGMSDDFPIADNTNEDGRNMNRRIEIIREN